MEQSLALDANTLDLRMTLSLARLRIFQYLFQFMYECKEYCCILIVDVVATVCERVWLVFCCCHVLLSLFCCCCGCFVAVLLLPSRCSIAVYAAASMFCRCLCCCLGVLSMFVAAVSMFYRCLCCCLDVLQLFVLLFCVAVSAFILPLSFRVSPSTLGYG